MRTITAIAAAFLLALFVAPAGQAHFLWHRKQMTLGQKVNYFQRSLEHDRTQVARDQRYLRTLARSHNTQIVGARPLVRLITYRARWHRHAFHWYSTLYRRYNAKLVASRLPAHLQDWLCIHRYEGSWTDGGAPYYGGLQMDLGFQETYGAALLRSKGTADHWTPLEQMQVAEKAYESGRGFYPWPNTARYCGLI